jgi:hypothetical protein
LEVIIYLYWKNQQAQALNYCTNKFLYIITRNTIGNKKVYVLAGFVVLTAVAMKNSDFWAITPCSSMKVNRGFRGTYHFHL